MLVDIPAALEPVLGSRYPHRPRVLFALRRLPGIDPEVFEQALREWRRQHAFRVDFGTVIVRAGAAITDRQDDLDEQFRAAGATVTPIDGYVSLDLECYEPTPADFATLLDVAGSCLDTLAGVIDPAESITLAGVANLVIPGFAPLSMILLLDRVPALSVEQYNRWWVRHADDHRRINPAQVGYHQLHIAPQLNALVAGVAGTAVTERCITDIMYLGHLRDAIPNRNILSAEESRALAEDIGAHVSMASVSGSFMREL